MQTSLVDVIVWKCLICCRSPHVVVVYSKFYYLIVQVTTARNYKFIHFVLVQWSGGWVGLVCDLIIKRGSQ